MRNKFEKDLKILLNTIEKLSIGKADHVDYVIAYDHFVGKWSPKTKHAKEKTRKWISLDDEIQKHNQKVRFRSENIWIAEGIFQDNKFVYAWIKGGCFGDVTHWMPIEEISPGLSIILVEKEDEE